MPAKLRILNARTPQQWAELIRAKWQDNVAGIFEVGQLLCNSREELGAAAFWVMTRDALKFSKATVSHLMAIATDERLQDVQHVELPASWGTLYSLTRLTDEEFQKGLDTGAIHAGMERKDVAQLKPPKEPRARRSKAPTPDEPVPAPKPAAEPIDIFHPIETHAAKLRDFVFSAMADRPFDEWPQMITRFRDELDDIEGDLGHHEERMRDLGEDDMSAERTISLTPAPRLLYALRAGGPVNYLLLAGEGIDNALDWGATRIRLTINNDEIVFQDNGLGVDKDHILSAIKLGDHHAGPSTSLGRFGVGIKIQSLRAGDEYVIQSVSRDGQVAAVVNWRKLSNTPDWGNPVPRWRPAAIDKPTGTIVRISQLLDVPRFSEERLRKEIAIRFYPALVEGRAEIVLNGRLVEALPMPAMTDIIDCSLSFDDNQRQAHIHAGLLIGESPLKLVHVGYGHRVLMPEKHFGCGSYSGLSKMYARVQLSGRWKLGTFKDELGSATERDELSAAVEQALTPILEKCQGAAIEAQLEKLTAALNDLLPTDIAARPRQSKKTVAGEKRPGGRGNVAAEKSDPSSTGPARAPRKRTPAKLLIEFDDGADEHGIGVFDGSGRPHRVILSKDDPLIRGLIENRGRDGGLASLYGFAIAIWVNAIELQRLNGDDPEIPELEGSFGQRVAKMFAAQNEQIKIAEGA